MTTELGRELHLVPGNLTTNKYRYEGEHIIEVIGTEHTNIGFRATRRRVLGSSKYTPHQGVQERNRRLRQTTAAELRAVTS